MFQIQQITDDALQVQQLVLPDGSLLDIEMNFVDLQQGWFFTSIVYGNFTLNGMRITNSPNMLYQFKNQIPFGIMCTSPSAKREPTQQQDFSSGLFQIFVLTADEVNQYTDFLSGQ